MPGTPARFRGRTRASSCYIPLVRAFAIMTVTMITTPSRGEVVVHRF